MWSKMHLLVIMKSEPLSNELNTFILYYFFYRRLHAGNVCAFSFCARLYKWRPCIHHLMFRCRIQQKLLDPDLQSLRYMWDTVSHLTLFCWAIWEICWWLYGCANIQSSQSAACAASLLCWGQMCHFMIDRLDHWEFTVYNIKPGLRR